MMFSHQLIEHNNVMQVNVEAEFNQDHWPAFRDFYLAHIEEGRLRWEFNLHNLPYINSVMLGLIVSLNTALVTRGGQLHLILQKQSKTAQLIQLARLDKIIPVYWEGNTFDTPLT